MASDNTIGRHSTADYGSAIIMSTSSGVKKKWTAYVNTSWKTRRNGLTMKTTLRISSV